MLDELLGPAIRTSSSVPRPHRASSGSTDMELLTSMAAQLSKAEAAARQYREALVAKDKEIFGLKRELAALQTASGDGPTMVDYVELSFELLLGFLLC